MATPEAKLAPLDLTLDQVVSYWANVHPDRPVLRWLDGGEVSEISWRAFATETERTADVLAAEIETDTPIAVICNNRPSFHVLVNALWRLGAGVVLIDRNWGPAIVEDLLRLLGCRTLFVEGGVTTAVTHAGVAVRNFPSPSRSSSCPEPALPRAPDPERVALYATTSGTSDDPKCVAVTHRQIRSAYRVCLNVHDFSDIERAACLFDVNSLGVLGICFLLPREVGAATTCYPSFSIANVRETWGTVLNDGTDFVYVVPPLVRLLNTLPSVPSSPPRRTLVFCAAAPVSEAEMQLLEERFPVRVFNCYGLTELTFAVFFGCRSDDGLPSASIGRPEGIQARIVDSEGGIVDGPASGELQIMGPMLTTGYFRNPAATCATWLDGWLRTGDIAERSDDGLYYIRGRMKDVVLRGGYTYYLHELEHYLRRAPHVVDACAFRGRDLPSGDELCVAVEVTDTTKPADLLQWIRTNMGASKIPNAIYVWGRALPRNSNGKVLRNTLSRMHLDGSMMSEAASR